MKDLASGEWGYCDPCWNAILYQKRGTMPYMLMGNEEIAQTHTLSLEERGISIMRHWYQRQEINAETRRVIEAYKKHKENVMRKLHQKGRNGGEPER